MTPTGRHREDVLDLHREIRSTGSVANVSVETTAHGPFERISLTRHDPRFPRVPQLSVYRLGDVLFDTGSSLTADALVDHLQHEPPQRIYCTHQHEDHVGGVRALREAFGPLPVHVPRPHAEALKSFDRVPEYRAEYWGHPDPIADALPFDVGDAFEVAGHRVESIESPGHTPSHVSFFTRKNGHAHVLSGDLYTSVPLIAWFESSAPCLLRSCTDLAGLASQVTMLPTHGRVRDDGGPALLALRERVEPVAERIADEAARRGYGPQHASPEVCWELADVVLGSDGGRAEVTAGEWSHACFARSVLAPVLTLPAQPLPRPAT